ncbi:type II toxin-antitoxin system Phd/YefM family antitoxin [Patescibacteria group bacterium]|nr:type II toxin-antitoxin system Phd/YefM family antitoxin [Patescibacteria group bacterium]
MSKKIISITEGRKNLFKIAEYVQKPATYYEFTVDGKPKVVLMSSQEFDSIVETMEILSDPQTMKNIKKAEEEHKKGEYISWDDLKKELGLSNK